MPPDSHAKLSLEHPLKAGYGRKDLTSWLLENMQAAMFCYSHEGRIVAVNARACEWLGYTRDELLELTVADINPEIDQDAWEGHWEDCERSESTRMESVHQRKDGSRYPVEIYISVAELGGEPVKLALVHDISERRRLEVENQRLAHRFQQMARHAPICVHEFALDWRLTDMNPAGSTMLGIGSVDEVIGKDIFELYGEAERTNIDRVVELAEANQSSFYSWRMHDGSERHFDSCLIPLQDEIGTPCCYLGFTQETTGLRLQEQLLRDTSERNRAVLENAPILIATTDVEGRREFANQSYAEFFGTEPEALLGKKVQEFCQYKELQPSLTRFIETEGRHQDAVHVCEHALESEPGVQRWMRWTTRPMFNDAGELTGFLDIGEDLTEQQSARTALSHRTTRLYDNQNVLLALAKTDFSDLRAALTAAAESAARQLDVTRVSVWLLDDSETILQCVATSGGDASSPLGAIMDKAACPRYFESLSHRGCMVAEDVLAHPACQESVISDYLRAEGIVSMLDAPILIKGKVRGAVCFEQVGAAKAWTVEDVDFASSLADLCTIEVIEGDRHEALLKMRHQAAHDALTGLINRSEFERHAEALIRSASDASNRHAMCFFDLDQFKVVNDTCGHVAGDELLRQLTHVLRKSIRQGDVLGRLGGDEFGVLLANCDPNQVDRASNSVLEAIRSFQFAWRGRTFRLGASIGVATIDASMTSVEELFRRADAACYMAKDLGRNRIHAYTADDKELAQREGEMQWVSRINHALEHGRFQLYLQPIECISTGLRRQFEVLLRMIDESGGLTPPGAFLPAAERFGLMPQVDAWVVAETVRQLLAHRERLSQIDYLAINVSGPSLASEHLLQDIARILAEHPDLASKLCFEITETAAIADLNAALHFIGTLRDLGCRFSLDDFGSGLSSFGYLRSFRVDYLKIDGQFVKHAVEEPIDRGIVKAIRELGDLMGMKTIAEFVENDAIKDVLEAIGVNYVQGYGIGRPVPLAAAFDSVGK